jgi:hypothetical protein
MSDDTAACAHVRVSWRTKQIEGGLTTGWWECASGCGMRFTTVPHAADLWAHLEAPAVAPPAIASDENRLKMIAAARLLIQDVNRLKPKIEHAPNWAEVWSRLVDTEIVVNWLLSALEASSGPSSPRSNSTPDS